MPERAEELLKIKEQQRQTREGLAALRQQFEDRGAAAAAEAVEVKGLLQQLIAERGTSAGSAAGGGTAREASGEDGVRRRRRPRKPTRARLWRVHVALTTSKQLFRCVRHQCALLELFKLRLQHPPELS